MSICVALETEIGTVLASVIDEDNCLPRLLAADGPRYDVLSGVDLYGDTIFNRLQMTPFLIEWRRLMPRGITASEQNFLCDVLRLAEECESSVHLYLKFIGD